MSDESANVDSTPGGASAFTVATVVLEVLGGTRGPHAALATVIERAGSAPQVVGSKLLLLADGSFVGTVGGGAIEAQVLDACRQVLREGTSKTVKAHLVRDLGMCCGGAMEVFVEYLAPEARMVLVGAGHVAQALAPLAVLAGFRVLVIDDREAMLAQPSFARCTRLAYDVDELDRALADIDARDYIVVLTRDHARDETALRTLLDRPHAYLGMIGSRRKVHTIVKRVVARRQALGRGTFDASRLHAPVGLALGGRTPAEIAISILAEIIATRRGGSGTSMSIIAEAVDLAIEPQRVPQSERPAADCDTPPQPAEVRDESTAAHPSRDGSNDRKAGS